MKVVVDTDVLLLGLLDPADSAAGVLNLLISGKVIVVFDNRVLSEYRDALYRPRFGFTAGLVEPLLAYVAAEGEYVVAEPHPALFKDEDDRGPYEVAVSGDASYLITGSPAHFPKDRRVVTPSAFLDAYRAARRSGD